MSKALENYKEKRRVILLAAQKLFLENGYDKTSMDKVADTAGVTKQTVYRYFQSKINLFTALIEKMSEEAQEVHCFGGQELEVELKAFGKNFLRYHFKKETIDTLRLLISEVNKNCDLVSIFFENGIKPAWTGQITAFLENRLPKTENLESLGWFFCEILLSPLLPVLLGVKSPLSEEEQSAHVDATVGLFMKGGGNFSG